MPRKTQEIRNFCSFKLRNLRKKCRFLSKFLVILPHVGSSTYGARIRMNKMAEENLYFALVGEEMPAPITP